jgi:hypothetical protein
MPNERDDERSDARDDAMKCRCWVHKNIVAFTEAQKNKKIEVKTEAGIQTKTSPNSFLL